MTVPAKEEECVVMFAPARSSINGNYNILEDHLKAEQVTIIVLDDNGKAFYRSKYNRDHGSFSIKHYTTERFQLCVQNHLFNRRRFDNLPRSVGISIRVDPPTKEDLDEKTKSLMEYSEKVFSAVNDLKGHFSFRKVRETHHRQIVERIFTELLYWTVGEAIFVVLLAVGGVLYLQHAISKTIL
ncbi:transmembrane emp24 domain trafficking protein 2 [Seminavis robusta]|uniref:Transmembrane emp24 domain trafficking protein 2 n=1 Tax=Seminavis robusta TaxID=568900 RepID=A0A9N8DFS7_9STRA|nr:transmembrane emp24 domain trafficking protein 2 [Seminavis robusta]|eukprot:Sro123_g059460.1 transmembrane emp24 domain trafficking protein 2 (184) ;mRNA; f:23512-24063